MKIHNILLSMSLSLCLVACDQDKDQSQAETSPTKIGDMSKISGLKTPESVVQAKDGKIYVSEINAFGQDGDGQITVIENGKPRVLIEGLDDPKGLAMIDDALYVADKTQIIKIKLSSPIEKTVFVASDAFPKMPQFLNDLEADLEGNLYVSDSGDILGTGKGGVIYKINQQGQVQTLIDGDDNALVMAPNGLLADDTGQYLIYVDFTSGILYNLNTQTGELTDIAEGFGGGDGVVHRSNGMMYISDWKSGKVFSVSPKGEIILLKEGYQSAADIAITKDEHYLMVPDMKAGVLDFIELQ